MEFFSGMDVSIDEMAICVVDEKEGGSGANFRDQCETLGNIMRLMRRELHSRFLARFCH